MVAGMQSMHARTTKSQESGRDGAQGATELVIRVEPGLWKAATRAGDSSEGVVHEGGAG